MSDTQARPNHAPAASLVSGTRLAIVLLTLSCVIWGATFLLVEIGVDSLGRTLGAGVLATSAFFVLFRFAASLLMPIVIPASVRRLDRAAWVNGFWLSLPFSAGFVLQVFGLGQEDVNPSQSAFLTSLYVVFTPMLASASRRRLPSLGVLAGIPLATLGAAFIAGPPETSFTLGSWVTVACALAFALQILLTDTCSRRADPMALTFTMLVFGTVWMALILAAVPGGAALFAPDRLLSALHDVRFVATAFSCSLFATVIAIAILNRWQRELDPSRAAIVYTSEPVFAAVISILAGRDQLTGWMLFGAGAICAANVVASYVARRSAAGA